MSRVPNARPVPPSDIASRRWNFHRRRELSERWSRAKLATVSFQRVPRVSRRGGKTPDES
jgi:hypothetical protein